MRNISSLGPEAAKSPQSMDPSECQEYLETCAETLPPQPERDTDRDTEKPDDDADDHTRDAHPLLPCKLIRRLICHFPETLNLDLLEKHFSYILIFKNTVG